MFVQLLSLLAVYILVGMGCALAAHHIRRRHLLELLVLALLWPIYAPFVLSTSKGRAPESDEMEALTSRLEQITARLVEIDQLLATKEWDQTLVGQQRDKVAKGGHSQLRESLTIRMEHIEQLHFLRKLHVDELEAADALLEQRKAQVQLSRFIDTEGVEAQAKLQELRDKVLAAEDQLASETVLLSLCRES